MKAINLITNTTILIMSSLRALAKQSSQVNSSLRTNVKQSVSIFRHSKRIMCGLIQRDYFGLHLVMTNNCRDYFVVPPRNDVKNLNLFQE